MFGPGMTFNLQQHVNVFNNILIDFVRLGVNIVNKDKKNYLGVLVISSYEHLMTTLTYGKYTITLDVITTKFLYHSQKRQMVEE